MASPFQLVPYKNIILLYHTKNNNVLSHSVNSKYLLIGNIKAILPVKITNNFLNGHRHLTELKVEETKHAAIKKHHFVFRCVLFAVVQIYVKLRVFCSKTRKSWHTYRSNFKAYTALYSPNNVYMHDKLYKIITITKALQFEWIRESKVSL